MATLREEYKPPTIHRVESTEKIFNLVKIFLAIGNSMVGRTFSALFFHLTRMGLILLFFIKKANCRGFGL
jgi:hypothetical protein